MVSLGSVRRRGKPCRRSGLGAAPTPDLLRTLMVSTAACRSSYPAIAAAGGPDGEAPATAIAAAAKFALIERLRRVDEPVLDTLLVSSLSPDLGPDDVPRRCG